jgi:hypothetical protein
MCNCRKPVVVKKNPVPLKSPAPASATPAPASATPAEPRNPLLQGLRRKP